MNKILFTLLLGLFFSSISAQTQKHNIVLELFTSQGCSSCPRADQLLKQFSEDEKNSNIIFIAYHVDYWNRLGWKDPFSKAEYSEYQRNYGIKFGGRSVYTPQLVINGNQHIVGSNAFALNKAVEDLNSKSFPVNINLKNLKIQNSKIVFDYSTDNSDYSTLNFALLLKDQSTNVDRGENRNRKLIETNIVIDKISITNSKQNGTITFKIPENYSSDQLEIVCYAQTKNLSVVGASKILF